MSITLAMDVGATNARVALVDTVDGDIVSRVKVPVAGRKSRELLVECRAYADELLQGLQPRTVGVSVCETVARNGEITSHTTLDWTKDMVEAVFGDLAPLTIESDVVAAGIAEHRLGLARGLQSFLVVNVGSGVSSSLFINGAPWRGHHGLAILIGEEPIAAERLGGGMALAARAGLVDGASVLHAAEHGDVRCAEICDSGARAVGSAIGFAINLIDPAAVIVSGGVVRHSERFRYELVRAAVATTWRIEDRSTCIQFSDLGDDVALIGAALSAGTKVRS